MQSHERTTVIKQWKWKDNDIGDEGAKSLGEALKINTSLTGLNLRSDEKTMRLSEMK